MKKKKVHKLQNFYPEDFQIVCIASHQNDYRLSWALNEQLNLRLQKGQDLFVEDKKSGSTRQFTTYSYEGGTQTIRYFLIANKNSQGFLFPDMKNIDFLLKVEGGMDEEDLSSMIKEIRKIDFVIMAFKLENLREKHKKTLIF
ncbi:MAG: IPExxxVDY family protein [Bacteroidales bacterium]|nr:IPExxxVDY family protein [Bacteroidales bacterium]MBS3774812.1 IPExxxVDY family protein [Bacteroidales bacterium]